MLYIKDKRGKFIPLSGDKLEEVTRAKLVRELMEEALLAQATLCGLTRWVEIIKEYRVDPDDLIFVRVDKLPDSANLQERAAALEFALAGFDKRVKRHGSFRE